MIKGSKFQSAYLALLVNQSIDDYAILIGSENSYTFENLHEIT